MPELPLLRFHDEQVQTKIEGKSGILAYTAASGPRITPNDAATGNTLTPGQLKKPPTGADKNDVELATLWALAAAMAVLIGAWGIQNRRAGYRRRARRALLEEGFRLLRRFEDPESLLLKTPAPASNETSVEQLVNLSLAVQSAEPEPTPELVEDSGAIHSPT
jgi:hypothetical protein